MRRRLHVWIFSGIVLFVVSLVLFLTRDPSEHCHHFISHRDIFRNCSGCFPIAPLPVLINQPQVCAASTNQSVDVIFVVYTKVGDVEKRDLIRRTWASVTRNNTSNFRHAFMLGVSEDHAGMVAVREEARAHRDVVVTAFMDSYRNLTLKTMTTLRWLSRHCRHARFFQKVDDDVWVNTQAVLPVLTKHATALQSGLGGDRRDNGVIIRKPRSKWYASCDSYPDQLYPTYAHGPTYAESLGVAQRLSTACQDVPFFYMEDVFLGLCQELLDFTVVDVKEMKLWKPTARVCEGKNDTVAAVYPVTSELLLRFWNSLPCDRIASMHSLDKVG